VKKLTTEDEITLGQYLGHGGYGVVVEGERKIEGQDVPMAFKLMKTPKEHECQNLQIAQLMADEGAEYILKLYYIRSFVFKNPSRFYCVLGLELGFNDLWEARFTESLEENAKLFIQIVYKILKGFKTLNFGAGYHHGDIKPENIILIEDNGFYEPRIIDFDLSFKHQSTFKAAFRREPPWMLYTPGFCPPEITNLVPNYPKGKNYRKYFNGYSVDRLFREDAFALGVTLEEFYKININEIDPNNVIIQELTTRIIPKLTEKDISSRWSTFEAFNEFRDLLKFHQVTIKANPNKRSEIPLKGVDVKSLTSDDSIEEQDPQSAVNAAKKSASLEINSRIFDYKIEQNKENKKVFVPQALNLMIEPNDNPSLKSTPKKIELPLIEETTERRKPFARRQIEPNQKNARRKLDQIPVEKYIKIDEQEIL